MDKNGFVRELLWVIVGLILMVVMWILLSKIFGAKLKGGLGL